MAKSGTIRTIRIGMLFDKGNFLPILKGVIRDVQWGAKQLAVAGLAANAITSGIRTLKDVVSYPLQLAAANEQAAVSFRVLLGSAEKATTLISQLKKYGAETPFEYTDLQDAAKVMLGFGISVEKVMPNLDMLANVASGDANKLRSLALVFSQISSAGKLTGGDLLQLVNAGFNPLNIIAKQTGESMAEVKERMSDGKVSFAEVEAAFKSATSAGGLFYKMNEQQSKTFTGLMSTLADVTNEKLASIGQAIIDKLDLKFGIQNVISLSDAIGGNLMAVMGTLLDVTATTATGLYNFANAAIASAKAVYDLIPIIGGLTAGVAAGVLVWNAGAIATAAWNAASLALLGSIQAVTWANAASIVVASGQVILTKAVTAGVWLWNTATKAAILGQTILLSLTGPKGWATIAAGAAIAAGAYYALGSAMDKSADDAKALASKNPEVAKAMEASKKAAEGTAGALNNAANGAAVFNKEAAELAERTKKANDDAADFVKTLQDEIATFGMSTNEAKAWKLAQEGANQATIAQAQALYSQLDALEKVKQAKEDQEEADKRAADEAQRNADAQMKSLKDQARAIFEDTRTPLEKLKTEIAEIDKLRKSKDENGKQILDNDTADRAIQKAKDEYDKEIDPDKGKKQKSDNEGSKFGALAQRGSVEEYSQIINHQFGGGEDTGKQTVKSLRSVEAELRQSRLIQERAEKWAKITAEKESKNAADLPK